jgi:very-short-patch-repair endonuclease
MKHTKEVYKRISNVLKGHIVTKATRAKISESKKGFKRTIESRLKQSKAMKGRKMLPFTKEHCDNMSKAHMGKRSAFYIDGRSSSIYYCIECDKRISRWSWVYGNKRCISCAKKEAWKDKEFKNRVIAASMLGRQVKPNKPEKLLNKLLQEILLKDYKFVGDGKVVIDGFCPDFINCNGQKKIIELYGDYWHNLPRGKERDKRRIKTYKKFGYKTLIVWEHELKDLEIVSNKIKKFNFSMSKLS